jgi:SAM-dependent methyltransferase
MGFIVKEIDMTTQAVELPQVGGHRVCPWWAAYFFDNPMRRIIHPPQSVLGAYVSEGMTVLDYGCGLGHYALGMARLTGPTGLVVAVDVQLRMLEKTMARAQKAGLEQIIQPRLCESQGIGAPVGLDFALISNTLHETPDPGALLRELFAQLKPGGQLLLIEPQGHLEASEFEAEVDLAKAAGFDEVDRPRLVRQMSSLLRKPDRGCDA